MSPSGGGTRHFSAEHSELLMFGSTIAALRLFLVTCLIECLEASQAAKRKILVSKRLESCRVTRSVCASQMSEPMNTTSSLGLLRITLPSCRSLYCCLCFPQAARQDSLPFAFRICPFVRQSFSAGNDAPLVEYGRPCRPVGARGRPAFKKQEAIRITNTCNTLSDGSTVLPSKLR